MAVMGVLTRITPGIWEQGLPSKLMPPHPPKGRGPQTGQVPVGHRRVQDATLTPSKDPPTTPHLSSFSSPTQGTPPTQNWQRGEHPGGVMLGAQHLPVLPVPGLGKFNAATRRQRVGTAALGKKGGGTQQGRGSPPTPLPPPPPTPRGSSSDSLIRFLREPARGVNPQAKRGFALKSLQAIAKKKKDFLK